MRYIIIILLLFYNTSFGSISSDIDRLFTVVNDKQEIIIKDNIYTIDMRRLLKMTAMMESRYGTNNYKGRVAKTPMQYELATANYYTKIESELTNYITKELDIPLSPSEELTGVCYSYIIYMSKLRWHRDWLDRHSKYLDDIGDLEWLIYKVLWNSIKGKSTYKKWKEREHEFSIHDFSDM